MNSGILLLFVFIIGLIGLVIWLVKSGKMKNVGSLLTPTIPLKAGMKILYAQKDDDEIYEASVTAASPKGTFIKLDSGKWLPRASIVVRDVLEKPKPPVNAKVLESPHPVKAKVEVKRNVKA